MKYKAIIETDDYKDFKFFEDGNGKYMHGIDAGAENNEWIVLYFKECKQEHIIDKIRAEITNIPTIETKGQYNWYREPQAIINDVLQIIDKAESEE